MKTKLLLFLFNIVAVITYGQTKTDSAKTVHRTFTDYNDLREQNKRDKVTSVFMVDSALGFRAIVPDWLKMRETGTSWAWGGTLPAVNGVENVILIKAFPKSRFKDIAAFEDYIIGDWKFMTHPKWSDEHVCYGKKDLDDVPGLGKAYRASTYFQNHIYTCKYVLAETKTAFLWIDFTSIPQLYDTNLPKFDEFLKGLQVL